MKKADLILILAALLAGAAIFLMLHFAGRTGGAAEVVVDGKVVASYSLEEDGIYEVETPYGRNTVQIEDGKVSVIAADCPDLICVHHAPVYRNGESIICLPHKLLVRVISGEESDVDAYAR